MENAPVLKKNIRISKFDSSIKEDTYILTMDKQQWHISKIIYDLIKLINGVRSVEEIYNILINKYKYNLTQKQFNYIMNCMIKGKGLLQGYEVTGDVKKNKNLWLKIPIIDENMIMKFKRLRVFYNKNVFKIVFTIGIIIQILIFLICFKNVNISSILQINGVELLVLFILMLVYTMWHEIGHATASMYYGVKPSSIGFGIYFIMPVFYTNVTKIWTLDRKKRVIVDIGGVYFNLIFNSILAFVYIFNCDVRIQYILILFSVQILTTLNPFIKMDGYWFFSDLIGIPNLYENGKKYIIYIIKKVLRIKTSAFPLKFNKREDIIFKIYIFLSSMFAILFSYWIAKIMIAAFMNISTILNVFAVFNSSLNIWSKLFIFLKNIYNNLSYYISIAFFVKIVYGILIYVYRLVNKMLTSSKKVV